jgi:hypothetical protein
MESESASGWMTWRNPPETRNTRRPLRCSAATSSGMPAVGVQGPVLELRVGPLETRNVATAAQGMPAVRVYGLVLEFYGLARE